MIKKILIANRGEIAIRLVRAAHDQEIACVAVYAQDDADALHVRAADEAVALNATGSAAYLDAENLVTIARRTGCDAVHPGYGFLSERADFAMTCASADLCFIGPTPAHLALFGDKASARKLALSQHVPLMPGLDHAVSLAQAQVFFASQQTGAQTTPIVIKAVGGGGGRGMRVVNTAAELPEAYVRCVSEARAAFGVDSVYVERLMQHARHIEVQVIGDGHSVMALGERECSVQRRFQKLVEIAPSPSLSPALREQITSAALRMARACQYRSLGTFEFLTDESSPDLPFVFIEANARLQVEHTITEAVTGLDLVQLQIGIAGGKSLQRLGLDPSNPPPSKGFAVQWRINAETLDAQGQARPSGGTLTQFDLAQGLGIRVDTHGFGGCTPSPHYDSLLAKLIVHSTGSFAQAARRSRRALAECVIAGVDTNLALLQAIATRPEWDSQQVHTRFVEQHLPDLLTSAMKFASFSIANNEYEVSQNSLFDSNNIDPSNQQPAVRAPMPAKVVQLDVAVGALIAAGQQIAVLEAMKMEHLVTAQTAGRVLEVCAVAGAYVSQGQALVLLEPVDADAVAPVTQAAVDPEHIRPDLQRVIDRHAFTLDANRQTAVAKRHAQGGSTARENIAALCDLTDAASTVQDAQGTQQGGSFIEYGALAVAAQATRRSMADLIANTPADGMVTGIGTVNAKQFGPEQSRCVIMAYDYMVLAGTQGWRNHHKKDRMLALAHKLKLPVVLFAEGGGGRPGDVDMPVVAGLNNHTFSQFAALSGKVPVVGIVHGRCFAGNAALLGCADVIIATKASNIGMGGPAMIEGGGLGQFKPEEIGPSGVQSRNGVIDVLVDDEVQAVQVAKQYLSYFQGDLPRGDAPDQRLLRQAIPENRLRVYDIRAVMRGLVDTDSLLELRAGYGTGILTALARIDGKAVGVIANNPQHLGGAIDGDAADKSSRFMQLCNAHGLPIVSLVDTPGFMVGPDIEAQAQVRHCCRMFVVESHLRVPFFAVVLRKGYGLGAQAMTAGGFDAPVFTVAWPTGEFGAMGLEGAVRLGFRKELEAVPEGAGRDALFKKLVEQQYANGEAMNMAATLEIDAVIDPAETRNWLINGLAAASLDALDGVPPMVDAW
jgi:acetyl/propionyl-CoA carboxylase alpha subunit/acetyl-CoA carboxylase carboxyltransferase component